VFGGMAGSALGTVLAGPAGTALGMLAGEILGEFIGGFLADMFFGDADETKGIDFLKKKFGELLSGGKLFVDFIGSQLGRLGNFFKDGFTRFIEDFPLMNIKKIKLLPSALRFASNRVPMFSGLKKFQDSGDDNKVNTFPDLSLLTPFGMKGLLAHLKNSFFPSGEKEPVESETSVSGGGDDKKMEKFIEETDKDFNDDEFIGEFTSTSSGNVKYATEDNTEIDPLSSEAENLKKEAKDLFNNSGGASSDVSAVSNQASYEQSGTTTVLLTEEPQRSEFASDSEFQQAMIIHMNQKEVLNNLYKTNAKVHLYKI